MSRIDADAVRELVAAHGAALVLYARQWCRWPDDAVQEAFVDLVRLSPKPDRPLAWLFIAVRRRALNLARGERRRAERQRLAAEGREPWFSDDAAGRLTAAEVTTLLEQLDPLDREIMVARIWGGLSFEEVVAVVDRPLSTVHRRYRQALAWLGERMNADDTQAEVKR